ncbi:MAG: rRNA maturation RNase YbeY [Chloroflexi bacterium]|nr:rRNA maturation RNase YbeY [Chloroflexota bacterium]
MSALFPLCYDDESVEINISMEVSAGETKWRPQKTWLRKVLRRVLIAKSADSSAEVSLLITDQEKIRELNRSYLGEDRPTDVLSFPMLAPSGAAFVTAPDGKKHLGEIIISLPQAVIQAGEHGHPPQKEITILLIHGVLHLLGYDHAEPEEEREMKGLEMEILGLIEKELE